MADNKVQIQVETSGAQQAAAELKIVQEAKQGVAGGAAGSGETEAISAEVEARKMQVIADSEAAIAEKEVATAETLAAAAATKAADSEAAAELEKAEARSLANERLLKAIGRFNGLRHEMHLTEAAAGSAGMAMSGPLMIAVLAVSAVLPHIIEWFKGLAESMNDDGEEAEKAEGKVKSFADKLADAKKHAVELKTAKEKSISHAFIEGIKAEMTAIDAENDSIARGIELSREKRRSDMERFSAYGALQLAMIDADKTMSEPEKIKARAKVEEEVRKKEHENKLAEIKERVDQANLEVSETEVKLGNAGSAQFGTEQEIASHKKEIEKAKADKINLHLLQESMKANQEEVDKAEREIVSLEHPYQSADTVIPVEPSADDKTKANELRKEIEDRKKQQEEPQKSINKINTDFEAVPGKEDALKDLQKTLDGIKEETKKLESNLPELQKKAAEIKKLADETLIPNEESRYQSTAKKDIIVTDSKVEKEKEKSDAEAKRKDEAAQRQAEKSKKDQDDFLQGAPKEMLEGSKELGNVDPKDAAALRAGAAYLASDKNTVRQKRDKTSQMADMIHRIVQSGLSQHKITEEQGSKLITVEQKLRELEEKVKNYPRSNQGK